MSDDNLPNLMRTLQVDAPGPESAAEDLAKKTAGKNIDGSEIGSGHVTVSTDVNNKQDAGLDGILRSEKATSDISHLPLISYASTTISRGVPGQPTTIHVHTSDDVIIAVPYSLLVKYSTFIAELPPLTASIGDMPDTLVLPLPSATSGGMRLVIALLKAKERDGEAGAAACTVSPWDGVGIAELQYVVDALTIADAYDVPGFTEILVESAVASPPVDAEPLLAWAICALAGDMGEQPKRRAATLQPTLDPIPDTARVILQHHVPDALSEMDKIREGWVEKTEASLTEMSTLATPCNDFNYYAKNCRGEGNHWFPIRCSANIQTPDWPELRQSAAEAVYRIAAYPNRWVSEAEAREAMENVVPCRKCTTRLYRTFQPALARF